MVGTRYAAWVIPPAGAGEVRLLDLGEAGAVEAARAVRQAVRDAPRAIAAKGEAAAERELRGPLDELARQVLRPLEGAAGSYRRWP